MVKRSQKPSFEEVYQEEADFVFNLSRRLSRGLADAEDLFQEVFLRVHRFLPNHKGGSVRGWLRRIVVNTNVTMKRGRKNQVLPSLDQVEGWKESIPDQGEGPLQAVERAASRSAIDEVLANLSEDFRTILVLREVESLDYGEIATILDIPIGTVRSRLARARLAFREFMESHATD